MKDCWGEYRSESERDKMKIIKEFVKKGTDINKTKFGQLHLAITNDNNFLKHNYYIEINIKEIKSKSKIEGKGK